MNVKTIINKKIINFNRIIKMKNYLTISKEIQINESLPIIATTIKQMTRQTHEEVSKFDNISYDNNNFIINLIREEEKNRANNPKYFSRKASKRNTKARINLIKTGGTEVEKSFHKKSKKFYTINPYDFYNKMKESPKISRNSRKIANTVTNSSFVNTQKELFDQCQEIENQCFTIKSNCHVTPDKKLKNQFKKVNEMNKKSEVEELRFDKKKVGVRPLMKIKMKNRRILQEAECVHKISNTLAFKANKIISNIFKIQTQRIYFGKDYKKYDNIRTQRKSKIKEMNNLLENNLKEHQKACQIYNKYVNTVE